MNLTYRKSEGIHLKKTTKYARSARSWETRAIYKINYISIHLQQSKIEIKKIVPFKFGEKHFCSWEVGLYIF